MGVSMGKFFICEHCMKNTSLFHHIIINICAILVIIYFFCYLSLHETLALGCILDKESFLRDSEDVLELFTVNVDSAA